MSGRTASPGHVPVRATAFAWSTIGRIAGIAGIAAWVAFAGALVTAALVIAGLEHLHRTRRTTTPSAA
jgi:hypothetical protein